MTENKLSPLMQLLKASLAKPQKFSFVRVGITEMKRTVIPREQKVSAVFDVDKDTYNNVAHLAIDLGITTDEILRLFCWAVSDLKGDL